LSNPQDAIVPVVATCIKAGVNHTLCRNLTRVQVVDYEHGESITDSFHIWHMICGQSAATCCRMAPTALPGKTFFCAPGCWRPATTTVNEPSYAPTRRTPRSAATANQRTGMLPATTGKNNCDLFKLVSVGTIRRSVPFPSCIGTRLRAKMTKYVRHRKPVCAHRAGQPVRSTYGTLAIVSLVYASTHGHLARSLHVYT